MNNVLVSIKRFFKNKNVVTVLGVILILGLLYFGYNRTIKEQTNPVRIPVATQTIQPRTLITDEMVTFISVPKSMVSDNVLKGTGSIVDKYTAVNTVIPKGSMFYSDVLVEKEDLPDSAFIEVPVGQTPYALSVTSQSTYGNSIFPGNIIDVYMKATDENGQIIVGRLLEDVKVLAVKDNAGNNVFEDTTANRTPSTLLFGVNNETYVLLKRAEYLKSKGVELFPVPYGGNVQLTGNTKVDREELVELIDSLSIGYISEDEFQDQVQDEIEKNQQEQQENQNSQQNNGAQ